MKLAERVLEAKVIENLDTKAKKITGFQNCRTFVQALTGVDNIEKLPTVTKKQIKQGDILWWGLPTGKKGHTSGYRHVAVYAGNGEVWQVDQWGSKPEKVKLTDVENYWDDPDQIFRP